MKRRIARYLLSLCVLIFALSATGQAVSALPVTQELAYDDGAFETGSTQDPPYQFGVLFSIPDTWPNAKLSAMKYYLWNEPSGFTIYVYDADNVNSPIVTVSAAGTTGWNEIDLLSYGLIVDGDFYVAAQIASFGYPTIGNDETQPAESRSYIRSSSSIAWTQLTDRDWGLRAVVEEAGPDFVVPEVPLGAVVVLFSMFVAFGTFYYLKQRRFNT